MIYLTYNLLIYFLFSHVAYLERNNYEELEKEDLEEAREVLLEEVLYGKYLSNIIRSIDLIFRRIINLNFF